MIENEYSEAELDNSCRGLSLEFSSSQEQGYYKDLKWLEHDETGYHETRYLKDALENQEFLKVAEETVEYGLRRNTERYQDKYGDTDFVLYEKYSYEDACRLMRWSSNLTSVMNGYWYDEDTNTFLVFINYEKEGSAIAYADAFIDPGHITAVSKTNRRLNSKDKAIIYKEKYVGREKGKRIEYDFSDCRHYLFVRKNKKDVNKSKEFYFLGEIKAIGQPAAFMLDGKNVFKVIYELETPVRADIFDYLETRV